MNVLLRTFCTVRKTVDPHQMTCFTELSKTWWDTEGVTKALHSLNRSRLFWFSKCLSKVIGNQQPFKALSVLDVGCGGGILSEPLSLLGAKVDGIDCNTAMIKIAKDRAESKNLTNLTYLETTIEEHILQNSEKYDVVVATEVIEHVIMPQFFLKCCVGCLKPGGSIFLTTNSKSWISKFFYITMLEDVLGHLPKGTHEYDMFLASEEIKEMLKKENCLTVDSCGLVYNILIDKWHIVENENIVHYAVHGIKSAI